MFIVVSLCPQVSDCMGPVDIYVLAKETERGEADDIHRVRATVRQLKGQKQREGY